MKPRHFLSPADLTAREFEAWLDLAARLKKGQAVGSLNGRSVGMLFFDPSLRTRTSMEVAVHQLGGHAVTLNVGQGTWNLEHREGVRMDGTHAEHVKEAARVLGQYVDVLGVRAFAKMASWEDDRQDPVLAAFAKWSPVPVLSLEGAVHHPCQALADALTLREHLGDTRGKTLVLTWAYHPKPLPMAVPNSVVTTAAMLGMKVRVCHPEGFDLDEGVMEEARKLARRRGGSVEVTHDPDAAYAGAQVVYAKSWGSRHFYGRWEEEKAKRDRLKSWIVSSKRMARTRGGRFMHCLPVRRNVVVEDAVLDSKESLIIPQAANRLHAQKAILLKLLKRA